MNTQNNTAEAAVSPSIDSLPTATTPARPYRSSLASRRLNPSQVVLTEGQAAAIPPVYTQDGQGFFATVYAKFFAGGLTWLATEYDADAGLFFGYVLNHSEPECSELGYFSVEEFLEYNRTSAGRVTRLGNQAFRMTPFIERDEHFEPCELHDAIVANGGHLPTYAIEAIAERAVARAK